MPKSRYIIILIAFCNLSAVSRLKAQTELIKNGDFEYYINCPEDFVHYKAGVEELIPGWFIVNQSTPDYFNRCSKNDQVGVPLNFAGLREPHSGNGYAGMILRADTTNYPFSRAYTEHLQTIIREPLKRNHLYCLTFYYVLAHKSGIASNGLGIYLSKERPVFEEGAERFMFIPQLHLSNDTILSNQENWQLFSGYFRASGEEHYLTIGNFMDYSEARYIRLIENATQTIHTFAYYLFDDISLKEVINPQECQCNVIMNQIDSFPQIEFADPEETAFINEIEVGNVLVLRNIYFDFDKSELLPESNEELDRIYTILMQFPNMEIEIIGHTDNQGSDNYNKILSEARAKAVLEYLYIKGIALSRMSYVGLGSRFPLADNNLAEGRQMNRRVEIKILKK